jgi:arabinofuranosyltransferase
VVAAFAVVLFHRVSVPFEDAAMLFRYAENVAAGHGIVFNPGGEHVDGATDLLFMLALGALRALGLGVLSGAALLNGMSVGLMAGLVVAAWLRWAPFGRLLCWPALLFVLGTPIWSYGLEGFATPTFAAACSLAAFAGELAVERESTRRLVVLGFAVALAGLVRPEGFLLGGLVVLADAVRARSRRVALLPLGIAVAFGVALTVWRWLYTGYPLPNPFYKKGGGHLYVSGFTTGAHFVVRFVLPLAVLVGAGFLARRSRPTALALAAVVLCWTGIWVFLSDEMNFDGRFQYAIVPVLAVMGAPLAALLWRAWAPRARAAASPAWIAAVTIVTVLGAGYMIREARTPAAVVRAALEHPSRSNVGPQVEVTRVVRRAPLPRGSLAATTEAGYFAWRSGLQVVDLWGLNDKRVAHHGFLGVQQLEQLHPALVFANMPTSNYSTSTHVEQLLPGYFDMTDPLLCFLARDHWATVGVWDFGPGNTYAVFVPRDSPARAFLVRELAKVDVPSPAGLAPYPSPPGCARLRGR